MDEKFRSEVDRILEHISKLDPSDEDYQKSVQNLKVLIESGSKKPGKLDWNLWAPLLVQLLSLVAVLKYEELNVLTSKAFGWIRFR